jgi:hypothetical protein
MGSNRFFSWIHDPESRVAKFERGLKKKVVVVELGNEREIG